MKRVMIVGAPGSGKSTLARRLGARVGLPVVHIDRIHWKAGWVERPLDERLLLIRAAEVTEVWIIEGGLSATWHERAARADVFVWLDIPIGIRLWRILRRSWVHRGRTRPDLPEGCPETFGKQTVAFIGYIVTSRARTRERMSRFHAQFDGPAFRLRTTEDVSAFLTKATSNAGE